MSDPMTKEQKAVYLNASNICPHCQSDQLSGGFISAEDGVATQSIECLRCKAEWTDIYRLVNVEAAEYPEGVQS
jgi:predicted Zn-ribbon and HTH transcriptional regulator